MFYNACMFDDSGGLEPLLEVLLKTAGWFCWLIAFIWAAAGISFFPKWSVRVGASIAFVSLTTFLIAALSLENRYILIYGVWCFDLIVLLAILSLRPRSNRDWAEDMQYSVQVQLDNEVVVLDNVRDFRYQTEEEFTVSWVRRRVPLTGLEKVWLGVEQISTWEGVAHIFVSFEYQDENGTRDAIAVSAEVHRQTGEQFSVQRGLFRNFELTYVVGTEEDLIGLRTHVRLDPVRLYPLKIKPELIQSLFQDVMSRAVKLHEKPEFYHTIANNCASNMLYHLNKIAPHPISKWDKRIILSGLVDRIIYAFKVVPGVDSLNELRQKYLVDISGFDLDENYSDNLRNIGLNQTVDQKVS